MKCAILFTVLFVAAGDYGLVVIDLADPANPEISGGLPGIRADDVRLYAHHQVGSSFAARAYVTDKEFGIHILDLLPDFASPTKVAEIELIGAIGLDTYVRYVAATDTQAAAEHDYLWVAAGDNGLHVFDITNPDSIERVAQINEFSGPVSDVDVTSQIAPPGTDDYAMVVGENGLYLLDANNPQAPILITSIELPKASRVLVEVQNLDRFVNERGEELKENSHKLARPFNRQEIISLLRADLAGSQISHSTKPNPKPKPKP